MIVQTFADGAESLCSLVLLETADCDLLSFVWVEPCNFTTQL